MNGVPEALRVYPISLGDQFVCPRNRLFLEVVAEGEVPEHLEEGEVAGGGAHDVDVDRSTDLLHGGSAWVRGDLLTEHVGLERHHAGVCEKEGGVDRDQRG